jgi:hypothetical protein
MGDSSCYESNSGCLSLSQSPGAWNPLALLTTAWHIVLEDVEQHFSIHVVERREGAQLLSKVEGWETWRKRTLLDEK